MTMLKPTVFDQLPKEPGARILRGAEAEAWQDGFRLLSAVKQLRETERARGYAEGRAAGLQSAAQIVTETTLASDAFLAGAQRQIAELALDIVRRVLGELAPEDQVARAAAHAIADFRREKALRIAVNPQAVDAVRAAVAARIAEAGLDLQVEIEEDAALEPGACFARSAFAEVEISIEAQLACIAKALRNDHGA